MTKQFIIGEVKDYFNITLGLMLYTFGFTVFLLPYALMTPASEVYSWAVCVLALTAAVEELAIHLYAKAYSANGKSIWTVICK